MSAAPSVVPPPNDPGVLSKLLKSIGSVYSNPNDASLLGMASGFGAASAPHMLTPVSAGQAMSMANQGAQQYRQQMVGANIQQQAALPYQVMRTKALERAFRDAMNPALPAHQRAAAAYQVDSLMGWNAASDPTVANRLAQIKANYDPVPQGANTTLTTAARVAQGAGGTAHGAVPEGSTYNSATNAVQPVPGAAPAIAAVSGAQAAGAFPYQSALKRTGIVQGPQSNRVLSLAPSAPPLFNPGLAGAQPQAGAPVGGAPGASAPPPGSPGVVAPGVSPAALAAQQAVGKETGTDVQSAATESDAARQQIAIYNQMDQALSQIGPTGQWRDLTTPLGHLANIFGLKPFQITSAAEFEKYRVQLVGAATKSVSPRASTQEMSFLAKSVPNYDLPGNAPRVLISELRGLSQYKVLKANALPVYLQQIAAKQKGNFGGTSLGFEKWWTNNGPSPSSVVLGSVVSNLPPAQRGAYVHSLQRTLTGQHMLRQYARARAFEAANPGIFKGL